MLLSKDAPQASTEIPTSSMADIAFLLLVFFIVTTSMNQDKGIGMTLPPPGDPLPIPKENIASVWINAQGQIALKALTIFRSPSVNSGRRSTTAYEPIRTSWSPFWPRNSRTTRRSSTCWTSFVWQEENTVGRRFPSRNHLDRNDPADRSSAVRRSSRGTYIRRCGLKEPREWRTYHLTRHRRSKRPSQRRRWRISRSSC